MNLIIWLIGFILSLLFSIYFTWFSNNYVYTYDYCMNGLYGNEQHKIKLPRYFYILYGIGMFLYIINLFMVFLCMLFFCITTTDGWTKYHYIGKNKFILKYIDIKNKIKMYLTLKV